MKIPLDVVDRIIIPDESHPWDVAIEMKSGDNPDGPQYQTVYVDAGQSIVIKDGFVNIEV